MFEISRVDSTSNKIILATFGPGCSKLLMLLVNVSLEFQTLISDICQYFLLKKCEKLLQYNASLIFSTKNISVFGSKV